MTDAELSKCLEVEAERDIARMENERLRAALKPFAILSENYTRSHEISAQHHRDERGTDYNYPPPSDGHRVTVSLGECRAAEKALSHNQQF